MKLKRVSTSKGKRWKKGQSCVSNPENTRFRAAAQGNFFQKLEGESSLTVEALAKHTSALTVEPKLRAEPEDDKSLGRSFNTFATNFTSCTIPAFHKFFKKFAIDSELQRRMLAIHAAAQEYIQDAKLPETSTSYMCALMSSLEGIKDNEDDVAATLSLLAKVIRKVSKDVLRANFGENSKLLDHIFTMYVNSQNVKLHTNVIGCLSILLRAQDHVQWNYSYTMDLFHKILSYAMHDNIDVRRAAQYNVSAVLRASSFMITEEEMDENAKSEDFMMLPPQKLRLIHPAAEMVGKFVLYHLKLASQQADGKATVSLLVFLQQFIISLPEKMIEQCCSRVLGVMHIGDTIINTRSLKVFGALFSFHDDLSSISEETHESLLNAITSSGNVSKGSLFLKIVPGINHSEIAIVWLNVVAEGAVKFVKINESKGVSWFAVWIKQLTSFWRSDSNTVREKVWHCIDFVLDEGFKKLSDISSFIQPILLAFKQVEKCLSLQYKTAWPYVFKTLGCFFSFLGAIPSATSSVVSCLKNLSEMMQSDDVSNEKDLGKAIGTAIKFVGPEEILKVIPLKITGDLSVDEPQFWILPLIKKHIRNARLCFFVSYFVPLTVQCMDVICKPRSNCHNDSLLIKTYQQIEWQIWALLPGFARGASDIDEALSDTSFAKLICDHIRQREDTRLNILAALRAMISSKISVSKRLVSYADKYFKALVNVFLLRPRNKLPFGCNDACVDADQRIAAFATIQLYLPIIKDTQRIELFNLILQSYRIEKNNVFRSKAFLTLTRLFMTYLDESTLEEMFVISKNEIDSSHSKLQKVAYRAIEATIDSNSHSARSFVNSKSKDIFKLFLNASGSVIPSAVASRLSCLKKLLPFIIADCKSEFHTLVEESIRNLSSQNSVPSKKAAFSLLVAIGEILRQIDQLSDEEAFRRSYLLLPPLRPCSRLTPNTITALMKLIYLYKDVVPMDLISKCVKDISQLITENCDQTTIKRSLAFVRIIFSIYSTPVMSDLMDDVVDGLVCLEPTLRRKFRDEIRDILSSFVRKFSSERMRVLIPESSLLRRVLINVIKKEKRHKRAKSSDCLSNDDEEEDEPTNSNSLGKILEEIDLDIENDVKYSKKQSSLKESRLKKKQTWIKEGNEEVLDLLDFSSGHNISNRKPKVNKFRFQEHDEALHHEEKYGFKIDKNTNKFIIIEEPDFQKSNKDLLSVDSDNDGADYESEAKPNRKRKRTTSDASSVDSNLAPPKESMKWHGSKETRKNKKFDYGSEFRSKKSGGDVQKKSGVAPYAYVHFSKDKLNRRKKAKYVGQFKNLVRGAKKGALKGSKSKSKKSFDK